jgi:hypothetical protein
LACFYFCTCVLCKLVQHFVSFVNGIINITQGYGLICLTFFNFLLFLRQNFNLWTILTYGLLIKRASKQVYWAPHGSRKVPRT